MKTSSLACICLGLVLAGCSREESRNKSVATPDTKEVQPVAAVSPPADLAPPPKLTLEEQMVEWKLGPDDIKDEMAFDHRIVRTRPPPEPPYAPDDVLAGQIKARLSADPVVGPLGFKVEVERVIVTLSGTAKSTDQITRAIALALDNYGVGEVVSQITVEAPPAAASATPLPTS